MWNRLAAGDVYPGTARSVQLRRVRHRMHLFQLLDRHLRVDLRRTEIHVPQDHLNVAAVGPVLEHVGRHTGPE